MKESEEKERKIPLVLYGREEMFQMVPPVTRKFLWFWSPEFPSSLQEKEALVEIGERLERFCKEKGKKVKTTLFTGAERATGRQESLFMVEVARELLDEQARTILMMNAPEPPRRYPQKKGVDQ